MTRWTLVVVIVSWIVGMGAPSVSAETVAGGPAPVVAAPAPAAAAPAVAAGPVVAGSRAGDYVGQSVSIEGRVVAIHESPLATVIAFAPNFAGFTATILAADREKFPTDLEARLRDKAVRVTGTVTAYRGKPEMALRDPAQLVLTAPNPGSVSAVPPPLPAATSDGSLEDIRRALGRIENRLEDIEGRMHALEDDTPASGTVARSRTLTLGASAAEVRSVLGDPAAIDRGPAGGSLWGYGRGRSVSFDSAGRVTSWSGF